MTKIAIIGAGLTGLSIAQLLKDKAEIDIFEKARGVGGRMSTRYANEFEFDHAAQSFTIKDKHFFNFLSPYMEKGIVKQWKPSLVILESGKAAQPTKWDEPHYVAAPRMNSLCKAMAESFSPHIATEIDKIYTHNDKWCLKTKNDEIFSNYDWVISTAPSPQTHRLLSPHLKQTSLLETPKMVGCMSLMLGVSNECEIPFDAAYINHSAIGWIAKNSHKPNRETSQSLMIQSTTKWAEEHMEDDLEQTREYLLTEALSLLQIDKSHIVHQALHRWRYADVKTAAGEPFLLDSKNHLAAAGDWCIEGRVENAFVSAYHLSESLKKEL